MKNKSSPMLTTNVAAVTVVAAMLSILAGCGKSDAPTAAVEAVESLIASPVSGPVPTVASTKASNSPSTPSKLAGMPPLSPDIVAILETNKSATVEHQIYYIVNADITPAEKAQALFMVYSSFDQSGQRKVAHSAVKFVDDQHYVLIREQLFDAKLSPQVLSVFMTDTLKRGNTIKLPVLFDLARYEGHPLQEEARQLMRHYCGKDYGANWDKWEQAMLAFLDKNPN